MEITPSRIRVRRRWLLIPSTREIQVQDIHTVFSKITSQVGQGARSKVGYELVASTGAGRVTLGDGIWGSELLHGIVSTLEQETGLVVEHRERKGRRSLRPKPGTTTEDDSLSEPDPKDESG